MLEWKKLSEEPQRVGYKTVTAKHFVLPDGKESEFTTWGKPGVVDVATIALTADNHVVMARQFRPGPEKVFDELPGGGVDGGEELPVAAARELREETGYVSDEPFTYLGRSYHDAYTNETHHYFVARNCYQGDEQELDETEFVDIALISIAKLIENARQARMSDSTAVLMAYDQLQGGS